MTSLFQGIAIFVIAILPVAIVFVALRRGRVGPLDAAAILVFYGALIVLVEHATFGLEEFRRTNLLSHSEFHFQMLAAYGLAAPVLVGVVVAPLIRRGDKVGWLGLLTVFVIGFGAETITAASSTPHGVPPQYWITGIFLWGYPVAWASALAVSYRPTFLEQGDRDRPVP